MVVVRRVGFRLLALAFVGIAALFRDPSLFRAPRFWAEEGTRYFQSAATRSLSAGLLNVEATAYAPYLHPIPQLATLVAAHCLPLELAPWATTAAWAATLLTLELVVLFGRAELLDPLPIRVLASLAPLLAVGSKENWVNTLGTHFYCDVALLLLLLEASRVVRARRTVSVAAFAVLAVLSPTSWVLVPAVVLLSLGQWRQHRPYAGALFGAFLLQAVVHFAVSPHDVRAPNRSVVSHLFVSKLLAWPLLGHEAANAYGSWAEKLSRKEFAVTGACAAAAIVTLVFAFFAVSRKDATTRVLLATWLAAALGYLLLGLDVGRGHLSIYNGGRYAFLPSMLLFLLLGHQLAGPRRGGLHRVAFGVPLAAAVIVGISEYRYPEEVASQMHGQPWLAEVRHFREDPTYDHLRIAPPTWVVVMPARAP
jgi:hypothetical protein